MILTIIVLILIAIGIAMMFKGNDDVEFTGLLLTVFGAIANS